MKKTDFLVVVIIALIVVVFITNAYILNFYLSFNKSHAFISSFIKFGLLATFGELLGLRIKNETYHKKGFGLLPKIIIWGFIGITIKIAFIIFTNGTPQLLTYFGFENAIQQFKAPFSYSKILIAFTISCCLNIIYAPVMMTFHKITDMHIGMHGGQLKSLIRPINFALIFQQINWNIQWHFVFKKTIPFFWIPAHTITFLLPSEFQVLFAAFLSIMLGLILALATLKSEN